MAEENHEQKTECKYTTILMRSGYRIDIGVENDDGDNIAMSFLLGILSFIFFVLVSILIGWSLICLVM